MNYRRLLPSMIGLALVAFFLSACAAPPAPVATDAASPGEGTGQTDPFAYCKAVGTVDAPDAGYDGPAVPEAVVKGVMKALDTPDDTPMDPFTAGTSWRCMDGQVWACFVGANLPCSAKADTSRTPSDEMVDYCKENPTSDFIPAVVTGRETVYDWGCADGAPEAGKQTFTPDAQGFLSEIWYQISPD